MNFDYQKIFGYDISYYQDDDATPQGIDFNKMKSYGASFVIVRAGQDTYKDEDFDYNWYNSAKAGIPRGSYWFGDKDSTGKSQAQRYWNILKSDYGEGPCFVDYEGGSWTNWNELYNFISEFQQLSGFPNNRIGIYTGYYYWIKYSPLTISNSNWFGKYPLWLAWYADDPSIVKVPKPWTEVLLWQQGTPSIGVAVGAESKEIDLDLFNGDSSEFQYIWGRKPTEPPQGEPMILYYADLKAGYTSNVRTFPGLSGSIIQAITGPVTVSITSEKQTLDGYDWYQISYPITGFIAMTSSYTNFRKADTTSAPYPVETTVKMSDGTIYSGPLTRK